MTRFITITTLLLVFCCSKAQESRFSDTAKRFNHEIGFNTVMLVKQLISNNPSNTLGQLPYSVFYNLYYKDKIGLRLGLGLLNNRSEVMIEDQPEPRTTKINNLDMRIGMSYNFVKQSRITLNAFADVLLENHKSETVNTSTTQVFGSPVQTTKVTSTDLISGTGAQVGVGVKYDLLKHLSIYVEVPLAVMSEDVNSSVQITRDGIPDRASESSSTNFSSSIIVPTTIYLVLRF